MESKKTYSEKELDSILDAGFKNYEIFSNWFISKTRFSNTGATYKWSRSDHPWGRFSFDIEKPETGEVESITRDSETDVLVVFEDEMKNSIALHIENKLANGKYTPYQPEFYAKRAEAWLHNEKYGGYTDFETVLVAPIEFYSNNFEASMQFDKFISYEEVGLLLPEFSGYLAAYNNNKK
jgi:hypothetical protein